MNYFEVFGLPLLLNLDVAELERQFHDLSRRHHPDYHANQGPQERSRAIHMTALVNDAYRTLRDPTRRAEYLVRLQGFPVDGRQAPPELLAEVFTINEEIEQLREVHQAGGTDEAARQALEGHRLQVAEKRKRYEAEIQDAFASWDRLVNGHAPEEERRRLLAGIAGIVAQSAYLRNLEREIADELEREARR